MESYLLGRWIAVRSSVTSCPSSIVGAQDLQNIVEAATGLKWPEPEMTATM
jgi:hypothetical protein